jgi:hypothetical protein
LSPKNQKDVEIEISERSLPILKGKCLSILETNAATEFYSNSLTVTQLFGKREREKELLQKLIF